MSTYISVLKLDGVKMNTVHAVKSKDQLIEIGNLLKHYGNQLYADLWHIGLNTALRISELLEIKYKDIDFEKRICKINQKKTRKVKSVREIKLNEKAFKIIEARHKKYPSDVFLFQTHSNRSRGKAVSRVTVGILFNDVGKRMNIRLGTHSMRKTRGYFLYKNNMRIEMISKILGHKKTAVTYAYIGIEKEDIMDSFDDLVL